MPLAAVNSRSAGTPPFCCSRGRLPLRLRRAGSCRGGRPARNATGRAAPEHLNGHGSKDRTVSLTFVRPSAIEMARGGASDALPGARLRPSRGEGYRKNCRCALRPENAVARAHLLGFGEIHARNARIVHEGRTSRPPRRVSPTCATACGVHRGLGRPNLTRCRLWRGLDSGTRHRIDRNVGALPRAQGKQSEERARLVPIARRVVRGLTRNSFPVGRLFSSFKGPTVTESDTNKSVSRFQIS